MEGGVEVVGAMGSWIKISPVVHDYRLSWSTLRVFARCGDFFPPTFTKSLFGTIVMIKYL